jgi:hypothetical protein
MHAQRCAPLPTAVGDKPRFHNNAPLAAEHGSRLAVAPLDEVSAQACPLPDARLHSFADAR